MTFVQAKICSVSSAGMPIISQMICSGSGAATDSTKSHVAAGVRLEHAVDDARPPCVVTYSSTRATSFGVKPLATSERSR